MQEFVKSTLALNGHTFFHFQIIMVNCMQYCMTQTFCMLQLMSCHTYFLNYGSWRHATHLMACRLFMFTLNSVISLVIGYYPSEKYCSQMLLHHISTFSMIISF